MKRDSAHKRNWVIGEVMFGVPFLLGILLHFLFPLPFPQGFLDLVSPVVGIGLIAAGLVVIIATRREFARHQQPTAPGQPTTKLIQTGVFAFSRNPLYLGALCVFLGMALVLKMPWGLAAVLVSLVLSVYVLILPEERYLTAKFGEEYTEYAAKVRRWLGRKRMVG